MIGRMHHFPCEGCGGALGRSGHYSVESNSIRCFQPACEWGQGWHYANKYVEKYDAEGYARLGFRPTAIWTPATPRSTNSECRLPDGFMLLDKGSSRASREAREYAQSRGWGVGRLVAEYGVGHVPDGKSNWFMNLIFPWVDECRVLQYYQGRDYSNLLFNDSRWKFPRLDQVRSSAADVLYNQRQLLVDGPCWVVEGVPDAITMGNAVGVPGKVLSKSHVQLLKDSFCDPLIVCMDEGAWLDTLNAAEALQATGKPIYGVVVLGEGEYKNRKKDANALGRERVLEMERVPLDRNSIMLERSRVRFDGEWTYRGEQGEINFW